MTGARRTARVLAQAKINIGLRVGERDREGYHDVETLFARLALADGVVVRVGAGRDALRCTRDGEDDQSLGPPETNLAWRAVVAYRGASDGWPSSAEVELDKRVPAGAGLGGGSADAAAVLRALDALSPRTLGQPMLQELARALGADVPFLTSDHAMAVGRGRGERLEPVPPLPRRAVVLVVPTFAISTSDAYAWLDELRTAGESQPRESRPLTEAATRGWDALADVAINDLEEAVTLHHPGLSELIAPLRRAGARIAHMTGSGSAVFGVFEGTPDLAAIARATGERIILTHAPARVVAVETGQ